MDTGNCLSVQWSVLCASTAEGLGSISGRGANILWTGWCSEKKKKDTKNQWAGRCDPGPLQGGSRGDWRWKMEKLKGLEDGSWCADPEGDQEGPEGMSISSPEWRQTRVYSWRRHLTVDEEKFSDPITVEFKHTEDRAAICQLSDDGSQPPTTKQECSWPQASPQRTGNLIFWINITLNLDLYNSPNCHWTIRT